MVARPSISWHVYTAVQIVFAKVFVSAARKETLEQCWPLRTVGINVVLQLLNFYFILLLLYFIFLLLLVLLFYYLFIK